MAIVEAKVKPERIASETATDRRASTGGSSWRHDAGTLYAAIAAGPRVWSLSRSSNALALRLPACADRVLAQRSSSSRSDATPPSALLQSRPHEVWARFFGSSMKDDLRYTPSDCFETFPFPEDWTTRADLEAAGRAYYEFRAQLMVDNNEGLTKTYNRFHDPDERDARHRQAARAARRDGPRRPRRLRLGRHPTDCEFLLDYEDDEEDDRAAGEEAVALPLARRGPRRGARPPARAQRRARRGGTPRRRRGRANRARGAPAQPRQTERLL